MFKKIDVLGNAIKKAILFQNMINRPFRETIALLLSG